LLHEVPMSLFEENATILRNMEAEGSDLGPSRSIDFSHVFPDRASADAFAREAEQDGFSTNVEKVEREEDPWDVTATKDMTPTCENITGIEERLDALAQSHHGRADGWGFFRV
jgi:hypothetical protein